MTAEVPVDLNVRGEIELYLPSSRVVTLQRATPGFAPWNGETAVEAGPAQAGVEVVGLDGRPAVPELAILRVFQTAGWEGVWIRAEGAAEPAPAAAQLLERIHESARTTKGDWDLCCWRGERVVFSLVKKLKGDRFGAAELFWLEAAFLAGLTHDNFLVVEWTYRS